MDWTLTTDRTAWELAAAVALLLFCGVRASAFLKTSKNVAILRFCFLFAVNLPYSIVPTILFMLLSESTMMVCVLLGATYYKKMFLNPKISMRFYTIKAA